MVRELNTECTVEAGCENPNCILDLCQILKDTEGCFDYLANEDLNVLARYFTTRHLSTGQVLWEEGDPCLYVAFVVQGHMEIKKDTEFEGKQVVVGIYGRGAIVGELCILDGSPRAITAVAMDEVDILILSNDKFSLLLKEESDLGIKLLKGMLFAVSTRLKKSMSRLASIF